MIEQSFKALMEGNRRFREQNMEYEELREYQDPKYVVISCSDSRITPAIITDSRLGSLFEIRIAGGYIDDTAIASVEFAVEKLNADSILVLGHTRCGAVTAAQELFTLEDSDRPTDNETSLDRLVKKIFEIISRSEINRNDLENAIKEHTKEQMNRLMESEVIRNKVSTHSIEVSAAMYSVETGILELFDQ